MSSSLSDRGEVHDVAGFRLPFPCTPPTKRRRVITTPPEACLQQFGAGLATNRPKTSKP